MKTAEQARVIARRVIESKFSSAQVAFCAGSIIRGEGTSTSDIDLVVIFPDLKQAWRESFVFDGWPVDRQTDYRTWPYDYQVYYWSLPASQQTGYWALTADQRGMINRMSPDQRAKTWDSILAQLAGATPATPADQANPPGMGMPTTGVPNPQAAAQAVPPTMPADPTYQGGPYKGALTPPPADAMAKSYPVCTSKVQDSCQNPGEGGAPGRSRATARYRGT